MLVTIFRAWVAEQTESENPLCSAVDSKALTKENGNDPDASTRRAMAISSRTWFRRIVTAAATVLRTASSHAGRMVARRKFT
jgi:hypothetical protein